MDGAVKLVACTIGGDTLIAYMARVSNPANQDNGETAPKLIKYLLDNKHWSPFEMVNMVVEINTTRDIGRQGLRHRSFTFQEFSQRYADVGALGEPIFRECRMQDPKNRQASIYTEAKAVKDWFYMKQRQVWEKAVTEYKKALDLGIAKEQARALLPEGLTPTRMYMNGTLRSWIHFIDARTYSGAQKEIQDIAHEIKNLIKENFPATYEAKWGLDNELVR